MVQSNGKGERLLEVRDLRMYFPVTSGIIFQRKIVEGIAGGALQPGGRIIESDIVRSLGVSRAPIREAMKMLEAHGIVRARERP